MIKTQARPLILMYHRVQDALYDPWSLCVSPAHFKEQMEVLHRSCNVLSLPNLIERMQQVSMPENAVAITFDDGYADNFTHAFPVLSQWQIPATFFLSTSLVNTSRSFWWDELAQLILTERITPEVAISIVDGYALNQNKCLNDDLDIQTDPLLAVYRMLWNRINPLSIDDRNTVMQALESAASSRVDQSTPSMLNEIQIRDLSRHSLITIAAHTDHHLSLPAQNDETISKEISSSCDMLETLTSKRPTLFSYPFGQYDERVIAHVKDAGLTAAVTTFQSPVKEDCALFELPRFQVNDWDARTFNDHLIRWFNES
jgi:peptidoglycan/xylan/chitin deacetylase (PgdA/CDA1 family)